MIRCRADIGDAEATIEDARIVVTRPPRSRGENPGRISLIVETDGGDELAELVLEFEDALELGRQLP